MTDGTRERVEKATIKVEGGQGVVVSGNMILTVSHCLTGEVTTNIGVQEHQNLQKIKYGARDVSAQINAFEPMKDIAVLGAPDAQLAPKEWLDFTKVLRQIEPVKLRRRGWQLSGEIPVSIYTHEQTWITGTAKQGGDPYGLSLFITASDDVKRGSSGSPVVDQKGSLLGLISTFNDRWGEIYMPHLALPVWIVQEIIGSQM